MGERVLVIDDDAAVCMTVEQILHRAGKAVSAVSKVSGAVALARKQCFDLLISDLIMPDVDGVTAIRMFKSKYPNMPIVAMSGGAHLKSLDTLALAHEAGADELLSKPFGVTSLMTVVRSALLRTRLRETTRICRLLL